MEKWLTEHFDVTQTEDGLVVSWDNVEALVKDIVYFLGDSAPTNREDLILRSPTEGWKAHINRWQELGKLTQ